MWTFLPLPLVTVRSLCEWISNNAILSVSTISDNTSSDRSTVQITYCVRLWSDVVTSATGQIEHHMLVQKQRGYRIIFGCRRSTSRDKSTSSVLWGASAEWGPRGIGLRSTAADSEPRCLSRWCRGWRRRRCRGGATRCTRRGRCVASLRRMKRRCSAAPGLLSSFSTSVARRGCPARTSQQPLTPSQNAPRAWTHWKHSCHYDSRSLLEGSTVSKRWVLPLTFTWLL